MKLVKGAKKCWRWFSMQALTVLAVAPPVWAGLPADIKAKVPDSWEVGVFVVVALGGMALRLIDQGGDS